MSEYLSEVLATQTFKFLVYSLGIATGVHFLVGIGSPIKTFKYFLGGILTISLLSVQYYYLFNVSLMLPSGYQVL